MLKPKFFFLALAFALFSIALPNLAPA